MRRIVFTERELDIILHLVSVAEAGPESEGDFEEWTQKDYKALNRLGNKAAILANRRKKTRERRSLTNDKAPHR